jgi:hypothetical protein
VRALTQAVKRNLGRFPADFMFRLSADEARSLSLRSTIQGGETEPDARLRSQSVILDAPPGRGRHRKYLPHAFTEHGVAMLSSVLRSPRAVRVNIEIVRTFVRLRRMVRSHSELASQLAALEKRYDSQFRVVFDAIRELMAPPAVHRRRIGFRSDG